MKNTYWDAIAIRATAVHSATRLYRLLFTDGGSGEPSDFCEFCQAASPASKTRAAESLRRENPSKPLDRVQHLLLRQFGHWQRMMK
jgi:hypothetical protein